MSKPEEHHRAFDLLVGRFDRCLSEFQIIARGLGESNQLDPADLVTLRHHAEDAKLIADQILVHLDAHEIATRAA